MSGNTEALPELPKPHFEGWRRGGLLSEDGFTAMQMREYARAAIAQQAADPNVLAALELARAILVEVEGYRADGPSVTVIDAAIAKATGEQA